MLHCEDFEFFACFNLNGTVTNVLIRIVKGSSAGTCSKSRALAIFFVCFVRARN